MAHGMFPKFPQHSWLEISDCMPVRDGCRCFHLRQVNHHVVYARSGRGIIRWIHGGHEERFPVAAGNVSFFPADGLDHTFLVIPEADLECLTLLIPPDHMAGIAAADGLDPAATLHALRPGDDPIIRSCLTRLFGCMDADASPGFAGADEAGRRLVRRLLERMGCRPPSWVAETGGFADQTMRDLVNYIDDHLRLPPTLADIAMITGLSPSHVARKVRRSVGTSLERFINHRRLLRSMNLLVQGTMPLCELAVELGFASQSHFTRVFSAATGMTPAKYRREHGSASVGHDEGHVRGVIRKPR